jgi:2-polyprenyl-3-methyl-5-hydroxy-6-metoxy-1,4-benzoquinol methylase
MKNYIELLENCNLINQKSKIKFHNRTRDVNNLTVWKDEISKVIYISHNDTKNIEKFNFAEGNFDHRELQIDTNRRIKDFKKYIVNRSICDFGFGRGTFIKNSLKLAKKVEGIETDKNLSLKVNEMGISTNASIKNIVGEYDSIFMFHVLEHLIDPETVLNDIKKALVDGGHLIIEVPSALDYLLKLKKFRDFSLWSEHRVLHTPLSLYKILDYIGFKKIKISSCQRYGIDNHLNWIAFGKQGGHKTNFKYLNNFVTKKVHTSLLKYLKKNDTLYAICEKK